MQNDKKRRDLGRRERWYLDCLTSMSTHLRRGPTTIELANWIGRSVTPTYRMLTRLESLGYATRDDRGRFSAIEVRQ